MDWLQFIMMMGAFVGLFTWNRAESRADIRHLESMVNAQLNGMREEMKDFHGRLCAIEERRK